MSRRTARARRVGVQAWFRLSYSAVVLRALVLVLGLVALLIPVSRGNSPASLVLLVCAPALVAMVARPGGPWVTFVMLGAVTEWVLSSVILGSQSVARLCGFAVVLFVLHRAASLAAALPQGAELDALALRRWGLRTAGVVVVSVPLILLTLLAHPVHGSLLLEILGALATVGVVVVLAVVLHRRQTH